MNAAAAEERYDKAQELQSQLNTAVAEAAGLEETWGFDREGEDRAQQPAAPSAEPGQVPQPALGLRPSEDASKSVGGDPSSRASTVIIHTSIDGRDSEGLEAADRAADAAAGSEAGRHTVLLDGSGSSDATPSNGSAGGGRAPAGDSAAVPASETSAWRANDLFDGLDEAPQPAVPSLQQDSSDVADDQHALPSRAPAEQLLQEARQATQL